VVLILDEPNANLDNDGTLALNETIRSMKADNKAVILMAHRPSALKECDLLLALNNGARTAFGPRDEVLRAVTKNHSQTTAPQKSESVQ
jgi:ATP-binding cassette subfamily C protein